MPTCPRATTHRYVEEVLFLYVANGVTTARGMLGAAEHITLRERLSKHEVLGPRLFTSGPSLNDQSVGSPDEAARIVREQARAGYDFVKVHPGPTRAEYDAAVPSRCRKRHRVGGPRARRRRRAARDRGEAGDDRPPRRLRRSARARGPSRAGRLFGINLAGDADRSRIPALVSATVAAGVWNVPTQTLIEHWPAPSPTVDELLARPEMAYVSPQTRTGWSNAKRQMMSAPDYDGDIVLRARHAASRDREGAARRRGPACCSAPTHRRSSMFRGFRCTASSRPSSRPASHRLRRCARARRIPRCSSMPPNDLRDDSRGSRGRSRARLAQPARRRVRARATRRRQGARALAR